MLVFAVDVVDDDPCAVGRHRQWLVLFTVLPWGIRSQDEHGNVAPGTDPGAPAIHGLRRKVIWTTVVATAVFGAFYWAFVTRVIAFEDLVTLWGLLKPASSQ